MKVSNALIALGLWVCAMAAQAGPITLVGDSINYVYDDSQAAIALLGTPRISGDVVYFVPTVFLAESLGVGPAGSASAEFVFSSVYNNHGGVLGLVQAFAAGDYGLANAGAVSMSLLLGLEDNDSGDVAGGGVASADAGDYSSAQLWQLSKDIDASSAFAGPATDIAITLGSELTALSGGSSSVAWTQSKFVSITAVPGSIVPPAEVPAPDVLLLIGLGMLLLGLVRNRKSQEAYP